MHKSERPTVLTDLRVTSDLEAVLIRELTAITIAQAVNIFWAYSRVSEQLYQKSTHFLLKLIQNADDNAYKALGPPSIWPILVALFVSIAIGLDSERKMWRPFVRLVEVPRSD